MNRSPSPDGAIPPLGHAIGERYRLDVEVGRTEAGVVFEALDRVKNRRVAIEVTSALEEPRARLAWARDAVRAQRLEGEHVLRVFDVGTLASGTPYAVREIATATLASELEARGRVPLQEAVAWTLEACEAIAEAHAQGMAHGDIRLDNVHLARSGDRALVKVAWARTEVERAEKEHVARDIGALGALLRILVTGRSDSDSGEDGAPTLPSHILHVITRALGEDDEGAFTNVAELARALAPSAPPGHTSARTIAFLLLRAGIVGTAIPTPPVPEDAHVADERRSHAPRRSLRPTLAPLPSRRSLAFGLVSLGLIGFVLGGAWVLWESGKLPTWSDAAAADPVGTTRLTNAPATPTSTTEPEERKLADTDAGE